MCCLLISIIIWSDTFPRLERLITLYHLLDAELTQATCNVRIRIVTYWGNDCVARVGLLAYPPTVIQRLHLFEER